MKFPSDKLYIPRISIREGLVENTVIHRRRKRRFEHLSQMKTIIGAAFVLLFMWVLVQLLEGGFQFFSHSQPNAEEIQIQFQINTPAETAKPNLDRATMEVSRRSLSLPAPMQPSIPEVNRPSPSATVQEKSEQY